MNYNKRIDAAFKNALKITYNDSSKFVFMSDCHRGDGSYADNFTPNENYYVAALKYYYNANFTYIELGDGDDLWETSKIKNILSQQYHVFELLNNFYKTNRFYMLHGNHDVEKGKPNWVKKYMNVCCELNELCTMPIFKGIEIPESIVLEHETRKDEKIYLLHGHQADFFNDRLWKISRFLVHRLWKPLELIGVKNPTTPAQKATYKLKIEKSFKQYCKKNNLMLIAGHTHKTSFAMPDEPMYFNDGSCVHPYHITAIEIEDGKISLVKWVLDSKNDGTLFVKRSIIEGPMKLKQYFR